MKTAALPLDQIQDITANYSDRQGLRIIPIGLAVMIQGFPRLLPIEIFGIDSMLVALAAGFAGYWLVGLYYRHRFGRVEELTYEGQPLWKHLAFVFVAFLASMIVDLQFHPPVFVSGLVIAAWLAYTAWPSRRLRGEYSSIAMVLALLSLGQLVGEPQETVAKAYGFWFGALLLIAGIRDHVAFVRFFPPLEQQHE